MQHAHVDTPQFFYLNIGLSVHSFLIKTLNMASFIKLTVSVIHTCMQVQDICRYLKCRKYCDR